MSDFELKEQGHDYWTILRRFNKHRDVPLVKKIVMKEMTELLPKTSSPAVRSRILNFLARNQGHSPSNPRGNGGPPRYA